jgi:hypothetical protein
MVGRIFKKARVKRSTACKSSTADPFNFLVNKGLIMIQRGLITANLFKRFRTSKKN